MLRSMWSGVTGLKTHQLEMDVIGNNIANVNTTSYKAQSTGFQDILYQTMKSGMTATQNIGAINASQVGLGVKMASINTSIAAQGSAVTTNNALDLMINGDSFFVIESGGVNNFSRDGSFTIDADGYLVTQSDGYYVKGVAGGSVTTAAPDRLQVIRKVGVDLNEDGIITQSEFVDTMPGAATTASYMKGNVDSLDSNLAEGRNISLDVYGSDGKTYTVNFNLTDAGDEEDNTFRLTVSSVLNENGERITSNYYPVADLVYDKSDGTLSTVNGSDDLTLNIGLTGDASAVNFTLDLQYTTNYAGAASGHHSTINAYKGDARGENKGYPRGVLNGISFGTDGSIYGEYSNGQSLKKGQIAVAVFNNAMGLEKIGDNLYAQSPNSGNAQYQDITKDGGYMQSGVLEGSNVDLAKEFTDMITTQRGFQANSKVITTSDEMLQILKGLKR